MDEAKVVAVGVFEEHEQFVAVSITVLRIVEVEGYWVSDHESLKVEKAANCELLDSTSGPSAPIEALDVEAEDWLLELDTVLPTMLARLLVEEEAEDCELPDSTLVSSAPTEALGVEVEDWLLKLDAVLPIVLVSLLVSRPLLGAEVVSVVDMDRAVVEPKLSVSVVCCDVDEELETKGSLMILMLL